MADMSMLVDMLIVRLHPCCRYFYLAHDRLCRQVEQAIQIHGTRALAVRRVLGRHTLQVADYPNQTLHCGEAGINGAAVGMLQARSFSKVPSLWVFVRNIWRKAAQNLMAAKKQGIFCSALGLSATDNKRQFDVLRNRS